MSNQPSSSGCGSIIGTLLIAACFLLFGVWFFQSVAGSMAMGSGRYAIVVHEKNLLRMDTNSGQMWVFALNDGMWRPIPGTADPKPRTILDSATDLFKDPPKGEPLKVNKIEQVSP